MDIQNLTNVSTVVINSLLMLLKDNHVDVNSVVMQLSNNKDEAISPEVNLGELTQQTLDELQKAKAQKVTVPVLTNKMICAIERKVEEQLLASAITADPFRLDGEKIFYAMVEAQEDST